MAHQLFSMCDIELAKVAMIWYSPEQKAEIGWSTANINIASAVRKYQVGNLRKQTVFKFKKAYLKKRNPLARKLPSEKQKNEVVLNFFPDKLWRKLSRQSRLYLLKVHPSVRM